MTAAQKVGLAAALGLTAIVAIIVARSMNRDRPESWDRHFAEGERLIKDFFQPAGPLEWSLPKTAGITSDTHILGAPMSRTIGKEQTKEAKVGDLTYRITVKHERLDFIEVSVRGKGIEKETDDKAAIRLKVHPDLAREFARQDGFISFKGEHFNHDYEQHYSYAVKDAAGKWTSLPVPAQSVISCTTEAKK